MSSTSLNSQPRPTKLLMPQVPLDAPDVGLYSWQRGPNVYWMSKEMNSEIANLVAKEFPNSVYLGGGKDCEVYLHGQGSKVLKIYPGATSAGMQKVKEAQNLPSDLQSDGNRLRHLLWDNSDTCRDSNEIQGALKRHISTSRDRDIQKTLDNYGIKLPNTYGYIEKLINEDISLTVVLQDNIQPTAQRLERLTSNDLILGREKPGVIIHGAVYAQFTDSAGKVKSIQDCCDSSGLQLDFGSHNGTQNNFIVFCDPKSSFQQDLRKLQYHHRGQDKLDISKYPRGDFEIFYCDCVADRRTVLSHADLTFRESNFLLNPAEFNLICKTQNTPTSR